MTSNEPKKTMRDDVLARIDTQNLRMHSRAFFALKVAGIVLLAVAILIFTILLGNLLFFTIRLNGQNELLGFGPHGVWLFLQVFPWWLLVTDIVLIVVLELLLRQFRFGYRSPFLYIFLALLGIAAFSSVLLNQGPLNDHLLQQADQGHLPPPLGALYQDSRRQPPPGSGLYRGSILSVSATSTVIADADHDFMPLTVIIPTNGPAVQEHLSIGEAVVVIGDQEHDGVVHAVDIHPIDQNGIPPPPNGMQPQ